MNGKFIYLFSSATSSRPAYRRGVLDALAYPAGHRMVMSYGRKYVQPELLAPKALENRAAAMIFVDNQPGQSDHSFIPIRFLRVVSCYSPSQSNRVELQVEFGDFILPDMISEGVIRSLPKRPQPHGSGAEPGKEYYFALEDTSLLQHAPPDKPLSDVWEKLASAARNSHTLADAVIFLLSGIRVYGHDSECDLHAFGKRDKVYELRPNTVYEMNVRVFDVANTDLQVRSSSDLLIAAQAFPTTVGGLGNYRVVLSCKRTLETSIAVLFVELAKTPETAVNPSAQTLDRMVRSSRPVYLVRIAPSRWLLTRFSIAAFVGLVFTSLSKEFFDANRAVALGFPSVDAAFVTKIAGSLLLAYAAWLGFRKLPAGPSGG